MQYNALHQGSWLRHISIIKVYAIASDVPFYSFIIMIMLAVNTVH